MPVILAIPLAWLLVAAGGSPAESTDDREGLEERVEVSADAPAIDDVAAFATVISVEDERGRGVDLAELLRRAPGARIADYGGIGSYATISLRASTAEQVTVLVDGVPQNRALGGAVDLSSVPLTMIDRVTVYRGFGPAAAGLGGIGGVIDIRTRRRGPTPETEASFLAGQVGTRRVAGHVSSPVAGAGSLSVSAEWLAGDGDYRYLDTGVLFFDPADDTRRTRANNDLESGAVQTRYAARLGEASTLEADLRFHERERGIPGLTGAPAEMARHEERRRGARLAWRRSGGGVPGLEVAADVDTGRLRLDDPLGEFGRVRAQATRLRTAGLTGTARFSPVAGSALVRLEVRRETAKVRDAALAVVDRGGLDRDLLRVTAERTWTRGRWTLAPSARLGRRSDEFRPSGDGSIDPAVADVDAFDWAAKLGARNDRGAGHSWRASVGRFSRLPSLTELFGDRGALGANPVLRPEKGLAVEAGYRRSAPRSRGRPEGEVVVFHRRTDDLIAFQPTTPGQAVAVNLARSETSGVELAGTLRPAASLRVGGSATWQSSRDVSGGFADGERLPYRPGLLAHLDVAWTHGRWLARWETHHQSDSATDALDTPRLRLPARTIHDLSLEREWPGGVTVGIELRNAGDVETVDLLRYPLPGRVWLGRLAWRSEPRS